MEPGDSPVPSPWQISAQFCPGQHPPAPAAIQPEPPESPEPVSEQHHEDDEEEDDDGREGNEPRLQHLGARACVARGQGRAKMGMGTASGQLCPSGDGTPHGMGHWQTLIVPPFPLSLGYQGSHPRHSSPMPSTVGSTGAAGGWLQISLLCPQKFLLERWDRPESHWKGLRGADLMPWGGLAASSGTPGHGGTVSHLWGHLPACPWAVAARTSRTRSERGSKGFSILGWRARILLLKVSSCPCCCRALLSTPRATGTFIGPERTSGTEHPGNVAPVARGR